MALVQTENGNCSLLEIVDKLTVQIQENDTRK